ncbi:MAG: iron ABC transporter permease [Candidatus Bathyarchaeota archaeon]|nr:iron ABC transporter permease [Candidatus Bathyarchaeota archaeon]
MTSALELKRLYNKGKRRKTLVIFSLFAALLLTMVFSISLGAASPGFVEALQVIFGKLFPFLDLKPLPQVTQIIVFDLRLPRIIMAILAGAGLAAAGATMQGTLRNPLVSSYVLGISSAAGFGAALAIVFGVGVLSVFGGYLVILNAFFFSVIAMSIVYAIARLRGLTSETVILVGVAIGFLFSAMLSLIQYIAPEYQAVNAVVFWLMGSLSSASWENIMIVLPIVLFTIVMMTQQSWNINVLSMGEDVATSLGVNSKRVLSTNMVLETLATAAIIAFTGVIGFVDLIAPHMARMLIGNDHRFLIPCSALVGGFLLLCSDTLARLVMAPTELPVGIVTSMLGVPFFIYIMINRKRRSFR